VNALHFLNPANVHYISRAKEPLLHRRNKVGTASQNLDRASVLGEIANRLFNAARSQEFE
jgi:hypothetical protein